MNNDNKRETSTIDMNHLADLFHEHRLGEISFLFIVYIPIGLCLVLLRLIALLLLYILSFLLPANSSLINDALTLILTFFYTDETSQTVRDDKTRSTKIIVSNRVSIFDPMALRRYFSSNFSQTIDLWNDDVVLSWFKLKSTIPARTQEELLDSCVETLERTNVRLIFQPECVITSGLEGLLKFNLLPFTMAQRQQTPVLPVCLRVSQPLAIRPSTFKSNAMVDLFWFLFSPFTRFHLQCLSPISPTDLSTDESICENVRESISGKLKIALTTYDEQEVKTLEQHPDLFYRRQIQRREEFQQMINLVLRQVPEASTEAIQHDLETTKNVDQTIANLKERAAAALRAANKANADTTSRAISKSSGSNNHRVTYERLKQELIEKNRQLFLTKNSA